MKPNQRILIIATVSVVAGLLLGWLFFGGSSRNREEEATHAHSVDESRVWTCSMHPQIRRNEPGNCPICGMELVPLEDAVDTTDPMALSMSPTAMQLAGVSTAVAGNMKPVKNIVLNGKIAVDERSVRSQSSHIPGRIEKLMVNFTGEYVAKGQPIAWVYAPELVTAQEELFVAQKMKESQPQLFRAAREKLKNWKLSDSQIEQLLQSGTPKAVFPVLADVSGYVTEKKVNPGDYIGKGQTVYEVADLSKVWILFDVYESEMAWIKKGDKVQFTIPSLPGENFQGTITYIDPLIDAQTRVAQARVVISNNNNRLKPGMFVSGTVEARLPMKTNAVVIPKSAVMWTGKRSIVYIKSTSANGVAFQLRNVTLGPSMGDSYIVESGLQEGEEIAVNGTFSIDAAAQLAGKPSMMNPGGAPAMPGHNHGIPGSSEQTAMAGNAVSISKNAREALEPLYDDYLKIKDHLVADRAGDAQKAAADMQVHLDGINMALFTGAAHDQWMQYSGSLKKSLQYIQQHGKIEDIRAAFQQLSNTMIAMAKAFSPFDDSLYILHCPMADSNKGAYWLSSEKKVRNPYFGNRMLKCGSVKETIQ